MALTITEALAEIKTIQKRILKKRDFVGGYLFRQDNIKDPLEHQGGSKAALASERQAIADLEQRIVSIRSAIHRANADTTLTIGGETRSIADWLVWRREVAPGYKEFVARLRGALDSARKQAQQKGLAIRAPEQTAGEPTDVIVNLDERGLAQESEKIEEILGTLDGLLSLKNATTVVNV